MTGPPLALQPRRHSLADLDGVIAQAEAARDRCRAELERLVADGRNPRGARVMLRLAEERLGQLRRSREVLLSGEGSGEAEGGEAAAP